MKYTQENVLIILGVIAVSLLVGWYLHRLRGGFTKVCPTCKFKGYSDGGSVIYNQIVPHGRSYTFNVKDDPTCYTDFSMNFYCEKCKKGDCPK